MEKMKLESIDIVEQNIEKIGAIFPSVITEMRDENGNLKKGINFELLKQELSDEVIDGEECYEFTWVGKKAAIVEGNTPVRKTLRPCIEESKNWETTENLYIEGDNLDVLKLLQESYLNSVKMIYIDPPYNTGKDYIYKDNFTIDKDEYEEEIGLFDEDDNKLFQNTETNGRFHSDWCSMMYPRLKLARNLLSEDGVIFISIDDNEVDNLRKMCDEVFGESNFVADLTIIVKTEGRRYGFFAKTHEKVLIYAKDINVLTMNEIEIEGKKFTYEDNYGGYNVKELRNQNTRAFNITNRPNLRYPFYVNVKDVDKNGFMSVSVDFRDGWEKILPIEVNGLKSVWRWGKDTARNNQEKDLVARKGYDDVIRIYQKYRKLSELPKTVWADKEIISIKGTREVQNILGQGIFDFPKPLKLLHNLVHISTDEDSIILDFFSGSSTTAHAVMQLNAEDGRNRKFIMVQIPEKTEENSEAYKAGYKNICEIGKERIRRAGEKIKEENEDKEGIDNLDIGFRVLKVDSTNMKDVYYAANEYTQDMLLGLESNIKEDRTDFDLLYGVMLDWGLALSLKHETEVIEGITIHTVDEGALIACFAEKVTENVVREIAKRQPLRVVFRDSSFASSPDKINVAEIFKLLAPNTTVKVI